MFVNISKAVLFLSLVVFLQACSISQRVARVDPTIEISKIYVQKNDKVLMEGFHPELLKQLNELGFATETYLGALPQNATYYMNYTANWRWDMSMYLYYFKGTLYQQGSEPGFAKVIGEVEYDAKSGGLNMNKLGRTAEKIKPLLDEMLSRVKRIPTSNLPRLDDINTHP